MFYKRIKNRLIFSIVAIAALFIILIIFSFDSYKYFKLKMNNFYIHPFTVTNTCLSLQLKYKDIHYLEHGILHEDNQKIIESVENNIIEYKKLFGSYINILRSQYLGPVSDLDSLEVSYNNWQNFWENEIYSKRMELSQAQLKERLDHKQLLYNDVNRKIDTILRFANNMATHIVNESDTAFHDNFRRNLEIFLASVFVIFLLLLIFFRNIYSRILNMHKVVTKISNGNYEKRCKVDDLDEIGELAENINRMTDQLVGFNTKLENEVKARTAKLEEEMANLARVKAELEQKDRFAMCIFNSVIFGVTSWDENGKLLQINDAFLTMTGYTREDFETGKVDWEKLTPEEKIEPELEFFKTFMNNKMAIPREKEILLKDGSRRIVLIAMEILSDSPFQGISFIIDISERKAVEAELQEFRETLQKKVNMRTKELEENIKLVTSSRTSLTYLLEDVNESRNEILRVNQQLDALNKELEAFSYSVSHDLKAPLRAIDGFSQALEEDYRDKLGEDGKEFISLIRSNAQKMGALINDLLEFSRLGRKDINFTELNIQELVKDVYQELIILEPDRNIEMIIHDLNPVSADRTMIKQVFVNLISNAMKFTRFKSDAKIEIGCIDRDNSKFLEYYISDNGVGFDMKYYDKLFGVFQRLHTDDKFEGTGVGLALIKRIITKHQGTVWAESKMNEGATFHFTLPKPVLKIDSENALQEE